MASQLVGATGPTNYIARLSKAGRGKTRIHRKTGRSEALPALLSEVSTQTLQDWFSHNGEALYEELKHVRNQLHSIDRLLQTHHPNLPEDIVAPIAQAHAILAVQNQRKKHRDPEQLELLFGS